MAKGKKFYVVFKGKNPGVYDDWGDALEQITGYDGARYKGYGSAAEAATLFGRPAAKQEATSDGFYPRQATGCFPVPASPTISRIRRSTSMHGPWMPHVSATLERWNIKAWN